MLAEESETLRKKVALMQTVIGAFLGEGHRPQSQTCSISNVRRAAATAASWSDGPQRARSQAPKETHIGLTSAP